MVAITFALPTESRDFVSQLTHRYEVARAGSVAICGSFHGQPVAVVHTGVGEVACRLTIESFLERQRVDCVVSAGFAGALDPKLRVGDLLIAQNFSSPELLASPKMQLEEMSIYLATLTSSAGVIDSADQRRELAQRTGTSAVDMETEFIAAACAEHSIPVLALRAISDTATEPFPAPAEVLFDVIAQRTKPLRLAGYLLAHPSAVVRLAAFAQRIAVVRSTLTQALALIVRAGLP